MPAPSRRPRLSLLALGSLLLSAGCASTTYEVSPPPARPAAVELAASEQRVSEPTPLAVPVALEAPVAAQDESEPVPDTTGYTHKKQDIDAWARHRVWLFLGASQSGQGTDFATGLRYGYFMYGNIGFGALFDYADHDEETWVVAAAMYVRPTKHFQITVAPGFEFVDGDNEPLIRTGFEYEFMLTDHLAILPGISFDIVSNRENLTNLGVSLQASF